jgi:LEA14-like dessication related protein
VPLAPAIVRGTAANASNAKPGNTNGRTAAGSSVQIPGIICAHVAMQPPCMLRSKRLLLWSLSLWLAGCAAFAPKFEKPVLSVVSIELKGGNLLQQNFLLKMNVQNPNDRVVPVTSLHVDLQVEGQEIASGTSDRAFMVPAHGEQEFDMSIKANVALALLALASAKDAHTDLVNYDLTGEANLDLPFLHQLPFRQSGSFSLSKIK